MIGFSCTKISFFNGRELTIDYLKIRNKLLNYPKDLIVLFQILKNHTFEALLFSYGNNFFD